MTDALLERARADAASVADLACALIRVPSQGGLDDYAGVLAVMEGWLTAHGLPARHLTDAQGRGVGLVSVVEGGMPGPTWVLDACLDTAPIGDPESWSFPPTVGDIADGWIRGRGSSDSKSGAAIFAHVAAALAERRDSLRGSLALLFDVDEHTGGFGGAVTAFTGPDALQNVAGVMIGYPGADELVIGGRGVLRARVAVAGVPSHSGSRSSTPNAVLKAADLVQRLSSRELAAGGDFPVPPKLTVTQISGGEGWSVVPASCTVSVDIRLTDVFDAAAAEKLLGQVVADVDGDWPTTRASAVELVISWPAYWLSLEDELVAAVLDGAGRVGLSPRTKVAGPSNIGNYLSGLGIKATAGFGLPYEGLHALDERVRADFIPDIHAAYAHAVHTLMTQG